MDISIHAPRVGSDCFKIHDHNHTIISIHAPRVGSDVEVRQYKVGLDGFQSTLPVWGATITIAMGIRDALFQSTLPVWGATLFNRC